MKGNKMKVYLANDLFSEAAREYNLKIIKEIKKAGFDLYAPQLNEAINDKSKSATAVQIYDGDTSELLSSDILFAVLDGPVIDPGVAAEVGLMAGLNERIEIPAEKKIIGLFTDCREIAKTANDEKLKASSESIGECQFPYMNLYVTGAIKKYGAIFNTLDEAIEYLKSLKK